MPSPSLMTARRQLIALALVALTASTGLGCSDAGAGRPGVTPAGPAAPASSATTHTSPSTHSRPEDGMQIRITIGDQRYQATLFDSAAARDLIAQLPVTIDMIDHGGVEKTGPLPQSLSLEGQPEGADPDVGDVGYYSPGNDLVLYYGDQSYYPGIVVLGRLDGDAAQRIATLAGPVTVTVEPG